MNAATRQRYFALTQPWAMPFPPVPMDGGTATVSIVDDARKLNINQLIDPRTGAVNPAVVQILQRLFAILEVNPQIIPAIIDWLDPDSIETPDGGAEADYYMRLTPPYQPRNGPMPTIGDLRMVRGVDTPTFIRLGQFLTALNVTPDLGCGVPPCVNANTAPPEVLASLSPELANDPSLIKGIVIARMREPFQNITDISNLPGVGENSAQLMPHLTVTSSYFTITGVGTYAGTRRFIYATFFFCSKPSGCINPIPSGPFAGTGMLSGTTTLSGWNEQ